MDEFDFNALKSPTTAPEITLRKPASDPGMAKTISDIEEGVPPPKAHWQGSPLPDYNVPSQLPKEEQKDEFDFNSMQPEKSMADKAIDTVKGVGQSIGNFILNTAVMPATGIAGLAVARITGPKGDSPEAVEERRKIAAESVEKGQKLGVNILRNMFGISGEGETVFPENKEAKATSNILNYPFEKLGELGEFTGSYVLDHGGTPGYAAVANAAIQGIVGAVAHKVAVGTGKIAAGAVKEAFKGAPPLTPKDIANNPVKTILSAGEAMPSKRNSIATEMPSVKMPELQPYEWERQEPLQAELDLRAKIEREELPYTKTEVPSITPAESVRNWWKSSLEQSKEYEKLPSVKDLQQQKTLDFGAPTRDLSLGIEATKDLGQQTRDTVFKHLEDNKPREALSSIADLYDKPEAGPTGQALGGLAKRMLENPNVAKFITTTTKDTRGAKGFFENTTGRLGVDPQKAGLVTVMHEMTHSATNAALNKFTAGELKDLSAPQIEGSRNITSIHKEMLTPKNKELLVKEVGEERAGLATSNVKELVAYGMTDPQIQKVLKGIPTENKSNLFTKLRNSIGKILGLKPNEYTFLDKLTDATDQLIQESKGDWQQRSQPLVEGLDYSYSADFTKPIPEGTKVEMEDGRRGTVIRTTPVPQLNYAAHSKLHDALHEQAFQGYKAGRMSWEQSEAIFDSLIEKNKDKLKAALNDSKETHYIPRVQIEGESKATTISDPSKIKQVFTGPQKQRGGPKDTWNPYETKQKIVDFFAKKLVVDPYWREAAKQSAEAIRQPENINALRDSLYQMDKFREHDQTVMRQFYEDSTKSGVTPEERQKWQNYAQGIEELTPEEKQKYDAYVTPFEDAYNTLYKKQKSRGTVPQEFEPNSAGKFIPRYTLDTRSLIDRLVESSQGGLGQKVATKPSGLKERTIYALEDKDGNRVVVQLGEGGRVDAWNKGNKVALGKGEGLKPGSEFMEAKLVEATIPEIEENSPYRYLKDHQASVYLKLQEMLAYDREMDYMNNLTKSPFFADISTSYKSSKIPEGWKSIHNTDRLPQLREYKFEPRVAEMIDDFSKNWNNNALQKVQNFLIKNMMLNPLPHIFNEGFHWYVTRGFTGNFTPGGMKRVTTTAADAAISVIKQDDFYRALMKEGGSILSANVRNNGFWQKVFDKGLREHSQSKDFLDLAKSLGRKPLDLYNGISKYSSLAMWNLRDIMYSQLVMEEMKFNKKTMPEAIKEVERHMPAYRIPERIGADNEIGRQVSQLMQNPNLTVFSRYHYGMVKSLVETAKDITSPKSDAKTRLKGLDQAAAMAVALAVVYPMIDKMFQSMSKNPEAEARRQGSAHLIDSIMKVASGKKQGKDVLLSIMTPAPAALAITQGLFDREFYSGKEIYHSDDPLETIAADIGSYVLRQVPQVSSSIRSLKGGDTEEGIKEFGYRQLDVDAPSEKKVTTRERFLNKKERDRLRRERMRELAE